jgi:hypothetical protein
MLEPDAGQTGGMQLYSASAPVRARQIAADVVALALIVAAVVAGLASAAFIRTFADLGRRVEDAGLGFQRSMGDAAETIAGLPLVGEAAGRPFVGAGEAASTLVAAGRDQQEAVGAASLVVGLLVAGVPIVVVLLTWLRRRIAFVRRAAAVSALHRSEGGDDLLALRALSVLDPAVLRSVAPNPVAAWRTGDADVVGRLADLALRDAGVDPAR